MQKEKIIEEFAANLRAERARRKYSQEYLAEKANISTEYLNKIEREKCNPSLTVFVMLAAALDVELDALISPKKLK